MGAPSSSHRGAVSARVALAAAVLLEGCVASVGPLLPQDVQTSLAQHAMRRLETPNLDVYYPAERHDEAVRFAEHVEGCARQLEARALVHNGFASRKLTLILPELTFNNAFTSAMSLGYEPLAVVPTYQTIDAFSLEMGLPSDAGTIACHEITHYVHFNQVAGFAWFVNSAFGEEYTPQLGFDGWFDEGLAVYYETTLQPGVGRLAWPFWHGAFAAGVAGRRLQGGDLSEFNRDFFLGNNYLVGSHFIRFLAERYGEWRLWKTIEVQAHSILYPIWLNLRFRDAYGKTLEALYAEFADDVARRYPPVARPPEQRTLETVGMAARYGRGADGSEALLIDGHDTPSRIVVRGPDGRVRLERALTDVVPPRTLVGSGADSSGPPSFTADGRYVYFTTVDPGVTFAKNRLVRVDLATGALEVVARDLYGGGGSISPDGRTYAFARADGDRHHLALYDVTSGTTRVLAAMPPGGFVSIPRYAPDGRRIVATVFDGRAFSIRVFDAESGQVLAQLTDGHSAVHDAAWADATHVVYLRADDREAGFQVYLADLGSGQSRQVTHAPYLAFEPQVASGTLRFLNRDGWRWTLDEQPVSLAPLPPPPPAPVAPATPAPIATGAAPTPVSPGPSGGTPLWPTWPAPLDNRPVEVLSDAPYSQQDHLFSLQTHGISAATAGRDGVFAGIVLGGADRLQFHRWVMELLLQLASDKGGYGTALAYANQEFAPFTIVGQLLALDYHDTWPTPGPLMSPAPRLPGSFVLSKSLLQAHLDVVRYLYGAPLEAGLFADDDDEPNDPTHLIKHRRAVGPFVSATYAGIESTPYSGVRRALILNPSVNVFPGAWNSAGAMVTDTRLAADVVLPLPLSRRHTLSLHLVGRDLSGLPPGERWLQVGGGITALAVSRHPDRPVPPEVTIDSLPGVHFLEPLRGYEDYPIATDRIFVAQAAYLYPLIIDRGTASTLWALPSTFLRQIDFELFGSAATDAHGGPPHAAGGTALTLELAVWHIPLNLTYQLARRVEDDRALVQILALGQ